MSPRHAAAVLAFAALASTAGAAAERLALPVPAADDLAIAGALEARAGAVEADRAPVALAWPLAADSPLRTRVEPYVARSREHWFRVTGAELEAGVDPAIASRAAVVRLSPLGAGRDAAAPAPPALDDVVIVDAAGTAHRGRAAVAALADAEALAAAGAELPEGSTALRLRPELGDGPFRLRVEGAAAGGATGYLVHVFEPESELVLELGANRSAYAAGDAGEVRLALADASEMLAPAEIVGFVYSPAGRVEPLEFAADGDGRWRAQFAAAAEDGRAGLWQAEVAVVAPHVGTTVDEEEEGSIGERRTRPRGRPRMHRRTARTAFAVALPTARLGRELEVGATAARGGLAIEVPVEVGTAGRYAVRATVAARRTEGSLAAVARAESAAWLEVGTGTLRLDLAAEALAGAAPGAELELVELELVDPGRLGVLERRALALPLGPAF